MRLFIFADHTSGWKFEMKLNDPAILFLGQLSDLKPMLPIIDDLQSQTNDILTTTRWSDLIWNKGSPAGNIQVSGMS